MLTISISSGFILLITHHLKISVCQRARRGRIENLQGSEKGPLRIDEGVILKRQEIISCQDTAEIGAGQDSNDQKDGGDDRGTQ